MESQLMERSLLNTYIYTDAGAVCLWLILNKYVND